MTTTARPGPAGPGTGLRRTPAPTGAVTRVAHEGGARNGTVAEIATAVLTSYLVYDGPRWIGVYQRADPPRTVPTPDGPADVWVAIDG